MTTTATAYRRSNGEEEVDRISKLPRPIIHDILSLLPTKDAITTSVLSKTFYSNWASFPVIDLDFYPFIRDGSLSDDQLDLDFIDYANRAIECRRIDTDLQKFVVRFPGAEYIDDERRDRIEQMILYAIGKRVKDLCIDLIDLNFSGTTPYCHPLRIDGGGSSVTKLCLTGAMLNFDLAQGWPGLVSLQINQCTCLETSYKLSNNNVIRFIDFVLCNGLTRVDIDSPSLEIFRCHQWGLETEFCQLSLFNCKSLNKLSLSLAIITDTWISHNIPTFPLLEDLELYQCHNLENLKVWNDNLKTIRVRYTIGLQSIDIRSQNLQHLLLALCDVSKMSISSSYKHLRVFESRELGEKIQEECVDVTGLDSLLELHTEDDTTDIKHQPKTKKLELRFRDINGGSNTLEGDIVFQIGCVSISES